MGGLCSKASEERTLSQKGEHLSTFDNNLETWNLLEKNSKEKQEPDQNQNMHHRQQQQQQHHQQEQETQQPKSSQYPEDDFYDGIPRYIERQQSLSYKSRSIRSTQAAVAKVSEVSSRLGRAGTVGIGMAVDVLDTLGSSMTNLNPSSGFISGSAIKGGEISILAFEVANTIVKGSNLMESLSERNIRHLKEVVLPSEGVQQLVSNDTDILLHIVAADTREGWEIFHGEVVRFGNRCKDPQWHNLDRYFKKVSKELRPQKHVIEEANLLMQQLMTLVQFTAELYHELHGLDRLQQDYQRKYPNGAVAVNQKGDSLAMRAELKSQKKMVKALKKKSLWSRSLEEIMGKLVDIVQFIHLEIHNVFNDDGVHSPADEFLTNHQRLGPAGLSLHYANIILLIDSLVARSSSMPPSSRDSLFQNLPPNIKAAMRCRLPAFCVKEELTVVDIKAEMEKTLKWLVPTATNTAKAHHGFGWVGEWASTRSDGANRKTSVQTEVIQIETLHHADKEKTELYILELLLWLQHLVSKNKCATTGSPINKSVMKLPTSTQEALQHQPDDQEMSKSEDFDSDVESLVVEKQEVAKIEYENLQNKSHVVLNGNTGQSISSF